MTSMDRRAREKAETRRKILEAARDLFLQEGVESVSMRKIADAIEYTAAAIYVHFPDKQSLILALCDEDFGALREAMAQADGIVDPVERLRAVGRIYVDFALEHPHHYRFMFMTTHPNDAKMVEQMPECGKGNPDEDAYALLMKIVKDCIEAGRFKPQYADVRVVTQAHWAAAHAVVSLYITHGKDPWVDFTQPRETAYLLMDACMDGMLAEVGQPVERAQRRGGKKTGRAR